MGAEADSTVQIVQTASEQLLWWPQINSTVSLVAFLLGILIVFIAAFAGARENMNKILFAVVLSSTISILAMSLFLSWWTYLKLSDSPWGIVILISLTIIFTAFIAVNTYETVIVSAREARPPD